MIIEYHNDPGHGWYKINRAELKELGISEQDISGFSYWDKGCIYLEEDNDASVLFKRLHQMGIAYRIKDVYHDEFPLRRS